MQSKLIPHALKLVHPPLYVAHVVRLDKFAVIHLPVELHDAVGQGRGLRHPRAQHIHQRPRLDVQVVLRVEVGQQGVLVANLVDPARRCTKYDRQMSETRPCTVTGR